MDQIKHLNLLQRIHALHRFYRYRWRTEKDDLKYLINRQFQPGIAIDIGANRGIYSYWLCKHFSPFESVYAFEPQSSLYPHLQSLKKTFNLNNLCIVNEGLSSQAGTLELFFDKEGSGSASYSNAEHKGNKITTKVNTLGSFFESTLTPIRFIKCDVEEHEFDVFLGATDLLQRNHPLLLIEIHEKKLLEGRLTRLLSEIGYKGFFIERGTHHPIEDAVLVPYRKKTQKHRNYFFSA
jgi:FkbM family methyltransferase